MAKTTIVFYESSATEEERHLLEAYRLKETMKVMGAEYLICGVDRNHVKRPFLYSWGIPDIKYTIELERLRQ